MLLFSEISFKLDSVLSAEDDPRGELVAHLVEAEDRFNVKIFMNVPLNPSLPLSIAAPDLKKAALKNLHEALSALQKHAG